MFWRYVYFNESFVVFVDVSVVYICLCGGGVCRCVVRVCGGGGVRGARVSGRECVLVTSYYIDI